MSWFKNYIYILYKLTISWLKKKKKNRNPPIIIKHSKIQLLEVKFAQGGPYNDKPLKYTCLIEVLF